MFYNFSFTIPANTTENDPLELVCPLAAGVIDHGAVRFPDGCGGLVYLQIKRALHQLYPINPEGSFHSNDETIPFGYGCELFEPPLQVELVGWNLDDTYDHILEVRFEVEEKRRIVEEASLWGRFKNLLRVLGV